MATLSGNKIKDTYQSLVKFSDNGNITTSAKQLTDGFGNNSPLYLSTTQIGIGVTPEATYDLHVYSNAKVGGNLTITGDLTVNGTTTTIDTQTLTVEDPLIEVASDNTSTDVVDIGWYGKYAPSGTTLYAGMFRDTGDGKFKIFKSLEEQPTTTVNTSGTGYSVATLVANLEGNVTGNLTGNVTGDVTGNLTGNVTGGTISGTTGTFSGNVDIDGTLDVDDVISVEGSAFGRIEVGGASGGYVDLKAPNSDDYDLRLSSSVGGGELLSIDTLKFYTGATTDLAFTIDASQNATFENNVTIPETPTADTHAASKGYVDAAVEGQDTLAEILANGNTSGANDIIMADDQRINFGTSNAFNLRWSTTAASGQGASIIDSNRIFIETNFFQLNSRTGESMIRATSNSDVELYYDDSKKLETTSTGITVTGTVSATAFSGNITGGTISGTTGTFTDDLVVDTDTLFVDASEDSVGIGLTNPSDYTADELVISVPDGSGMTLVSGTTDAAYITFMSSTGAIATNGGYIGYDHDADGLTMFAQSKVSVAILEAEVAYFTDTAFYVDKSTTIDDNLSVSDDLGVGISVPLYKLDVVSSAADTARFTSTSSTTTNVYIGNSNATANNTANLYFMPANNIAGSYIKSTAIEDFSTAANRTSDLRFGVRKDGTFNEAVIIDSSGNATFTGQVIASSSSSGDYVRMYGGSGTAQWDIYGNGENLRFSENSGGGGHVDIDTNLIVDGNVGIGTTSPMTTLHVQQSNGSYPDDANNHLVVESSSHSYIGIGGGTSSDVGIHFGDSGGINLGRIAYKNSDNSMRFNTNSGERMIIDSSGNVGIGIDPSYKLEIKSSGAGNYIQHFVSSDGASLGGFYENADTDALFFLKNASGAIKVEIDSDGDSYFNGGNVGIGTSSPNRQLSIYGTNDGYMSFDGGRAGNHEFVVGSDTAGFIIYDDTLNTYRFVIDQDSGNVGIGTTDPQSKLHIQTEAAPTDIYLTDGTVGSDNYGGVIRGFSVAGQGGRLQLGTLDNDVYYPAITIKQQGGNVGIGTDSPAEKLDVVEAIRIQAQSGGTNNATLVLTARNGGAYGNTLVARSDIQSTTDGTAYGSDLLFKTTDSSNTKATRMTIDSSGNVLVQATSIGGNGLSIRPNATAGTVQQVFNRASTTSDSYIFDFQNGGTTVGYIRYNNTTTTYATSSDYRLKENVVEMTGALDRVSQLKPSRFNFIADADTTVDGFLAHEVQEIVPEAITGEKDAVDEEGNPEYQGIDQSKLVPLLVGAIQELKAEIELLKTQINN